MLDLLFADKALLFSIPALVGTFFFAVRLVMMVTGVAGDADAHGGAGIDLTQGDPHHSSELFKILSVQGIGAFLMGFGWAGLGALYGGKWPMGTSLLVGLVGGIALMWLLSWLLKLVYDLQSTGTISIQSAMGAEGDVYVTVPPRGQGQGQVRVIVKDRQRLYNAISDGEPLPTNTRVRVSRVNEDNTLTVERLGAAGGP
jgi:hypothetical protein